MLISDWYSDVCSSDLRRVVTVDLRNHGDSPWADAMDYRAMADDLRALLERLGAGPAAVMGHSMGGKVAMMLALTAPELVERLIVVDIAPVLYDKPGVLVYADTLRRLDLSGLSRRGAARSEEHTSELQSLMRISYAVFSLQKKKK